MGASEEEVATLVRQSERILDAVLTEQLQKVQQKQNDILKEMLEVENLRDHIPLVRLQAQHVTKERRRLDAALQDMRIRPPAPQPLQQQNDQPQQRRPIEPFPLLCLTDIGSHCYLPAVARDASHLLVSVGFNFFLEMHLDEAEAFLKKKQDLLRKKHELWAWKSAQLKTQIRMLMEAISAVSEHPMLQELL
ncbi:uncharacterized protein LOC34619945 [Cyclospora cayetanensis]|uniref:Uncharacterized protein LOC34619945 n=1 Tax=Cyclospora cayetanensis TaxID=88456 RepID=A0A6P6S4D6_9EIME|nr:uncharacterized protein LOC34619945 [Cyclospora cayetanensis]